MSRKNEVIGVRLTHHDHESLQRLAEDCGLTVSELLRQAVMLSKKSLREFYKGRFTENEARMES